MSTRDKSQLAGTRRDLFKAGLALTIAMHLPGLGRASAAKSVAGSRLEPNAFVRIGVDDSVTILAKHVEMGQGIYTGLATMVAEELDADWSKVRVEGAPADAKLYRNLAFSTLQGTGGSTSTTNSWEQMRMAGATARAVLVASAAQRWKVPVTEITVTSGVVEHKSSGRQARFGGLVADAVKLPVPSDVPLKDPSKFVLIGKDIGRVDAREKSDGTAIFTQDIRLPGMLVAAVVHPPRFGAKLKSFDASEAKAIKGVRHVVAFETSVRCGVAVLANDFWTAKKGAEAMTVEWDESAAFKRSSEELFAEYREIAKRPGMKAKQVGDADRAFAKAARTLEATYEFPFLAHAAMEPINCVVRVGPDDCEVWNGEQYQTIDQMSLSRLLGLPPSKVQIHQLYAGGSFGRRANPMSDYLVETAAIAKAAALHVPVKMVWTREQDMRAGFYRPLYVHSLKAGLDKSGKLIAWRHRVVGQSVMSALSMYWPPPELDETSVEGAATLPYEIPNLAVELHTTKLAVPIQWWRSVGASHSAYSTECFIDEIARETKQDTYAMRRALLSQKHARHRAVLDLVAQKSGWNSLRPKDEAWGLALHESFDTVVAQVAQLKRTDGGLRLQKVICAVDCGIAVNPNIVAMQMESGIGFGLAAALTGAITLKDGRVEQSNFDDYQVLRMNQMPGIDVHIVPSSAKPTGVGEPGTPVIAPALANALAAATGKALYTLPLSSQGMTFV